jgi:NAD(P)H-hydrate epimerase
MKAAGIELRELPTKDDWDDALYGRPAPAEILVDGLLGTGTKGPARGPVVGAIEYLNKNSDDGLVVAIDIPSGLNADTGEAMGDAVRADVTVTMALPKVGLVQPTATEYVGSLEVVDIGFPPECVSKLPNEHGLELVYTQDLRSVYPRRKAAAHKGDFGHVLLVGGAKGYSGAITLATRAALRSGAGLVSVCTPESIAPVVAGAAPEAMVRAAAQTETGSLSADAWTGAEDFDAVLLGPGLTRSEATRALVDRVLDECNAPLVLDADALSVLAGEPERLRDAQGPVVITPHPGELASLAGCSSDDVQMDRLAAVTSMAERMNGTVVLKGAGTLIAHPGETSWVCGCGNPGMATGGTGDVLAGLMTGLVGQGFGPQTAARMAVYVHARAGDVVAMRKSQAGLTAGDLVEEIPYAFRELTLR